MQKMQRVVRSTFTLLLTSLNLIVRMIAIVALVYSEFGIIVNDQKYVISLQEKNNIEYSFRIT